MTKKRHDILNDCPLTEPFMKFKKNTLALYELVTTAESKLKQEKEELKNLLEEVGEGRIIGNNSISGLLGLAEQVQEKISQMKGIESG